VGEVVGEPGVVTDGNVGYQEILGFAVDFDCAHVQGCSVALYSESQVADS
jgi:hypothetical protein